MRETRQPLSLRLTGFVVCLEILAGSNTLEGRGVRGGGGDGGGLQEGERAGRERKLSRNISLSQLTCFCFKKWASLSAASRFDEFRRAQTLTSASEL